jgi:hypothetical protein
MFLYRVFDDDGFYLGRVKHKRELIPHQFVSQDGTVYRINYVGGGGHSLRVSEVEAGRWEAEIQRPNASSPAVDW